MASEVLLDPYSQGTWSPLAVTVGGRKSWEELRQGVRDTMKLLTSIGGSAPTAFTFFPLPGAVAAAAQGASHRLYFLAVPDKGRESTLLYVDLTPDQTNQRASAWRPLLATTAPSGQLSREEQLMRERKRLGAYGITAFDFHPAPRRFVFPANSALYVVDDDLSGEPLQPRVVGAGTPSGAKLDPKLCPGCPDIVAFVLNADLWAACLATGEEIQLTFTCTNPLSERLSDNPVSAGAPAFVISEEFDRYTGYWWQPATGHTQDGTFRLLYEEVDESDVEVIRLSGGAGEEHRYPRAGSNNARSTLKVAEFSLGGGGGVTERRLAQPLSHHCPWAEYLVRAGWTPDGRFVFAQLMDRSQQRLCILLIPLSYFVPTPSPHAPGSSPHPHLPPHSPPVPQVSSPVRCIYTESSPVWINVHDSLHFLPQTSEREISFIWASQKSGFRHLYLVTSPLDTTTGLDQHVEGGSTLSSFEGNLTSLTEVQLTRGDWEVMPRPTWLDSGRGLIFFTATKDTPLETHLYAVSYVHPDEPVRLTEPGFSHAVSMSSDCDMYVSTFSSTDSAPLTSVYRVGSRVAALGGPDSEPALAMALGVQDSEPALAVANLALLTEPPVCFNYQSPELFSFQSSGSGHRLYGTFFRPHNWRAGVRYPTVLFVYGGPQVQLVTNAFKGLKLLRLHTLAAQGYAVVMLDGRGSSNRGMGFEASIRHSLGTVEIEDQVEGLQWLAAETDMIDLDRVCIHGWSYGGYLALMGLALRPDVFKLAVAGAPVVQWELYDTGYTERYMSLPALNAAGYQQGCVLTHLHRLPAQENRLLIVHGLMDENVHVTHTNSLVAALVKACKPHRLQVYPNERHGIRSPEANEHYKTLVLSFLQDNL